MSLGCAYFDFPCSCNTEATARKSPWRYTVDGDPFSLRPFDQMYMVRLQWLTRCHGRGINAGASRGKKEWLCDATVQAKLELFNEVKKTLVTATSPAIDSRKHCGSRERRECACMPCSRWTSWDWRSASMPCEGGLWSSWKFIVLYMLSNSLLVQAFRSACLGGYADVCST